ncbi:histone-lysine N-methyltransferase PRDM9 isoform X1 [Tachysurus fulvidraco]|uniref:histone-lysine N-methyltransferase PRDM9 isoform X1 n=2 Tax=Tachysurus fulvidraco TaxID=1234273 RepID=UPI001FEF1746|nr:histone-lysine N-methyltransferase PRDM9 isoform X1 [Tachysurus fulvidraco]
MTDSPGLPSGEDQNLEIQGSVTVCNIETEESQEENAFNDKHFYCETCHKLYLDQCDVHGPPLFTYDTPTPVGVPQRALLTLPQGLVIGRSTTPGAGLGVFNQGQIVPLGMYFGPLDGEVTGTEKALESAYSWMICRGSDRCDFIDTERDTHSNWMRYVVCSRSEHEQNLVAFQQDGRILFRCCRPIYPGQELKVWYAEDYAQSLCTTWDKIWDKKCTPIGRNCDEASQLCLCPYCQYSFPAAFYLHRHVRRSHPDEYPHLLETQAIEPSDQTPVMNLDHCLLASDAPPPSEMQQMTKSLQSQFPGLHDQTEQPNPNDPSAHENCSDLMNDTDQGNAGVVEVSRNKCGECGRIFLRSCHLKRHQRTIHSKEKPYCCSHCRKCFSQATGLKRHQQTHQGDKEKTEGTQQAEKGDAVYSCTKCSFSFITKLNLYRHLKRHHHGEYLKLVENESSNAESALQHANSSDKHDPPYEPPAKLRRSALNLNRAGNQKRKVPTGRPRGRPPKIKKKHIQKPVKDTVQEENQNKCSEADQTANDSESTVVSEWTNAGGKEPQEMAQETSSHVCGECLRTFSHLHLLKSHECIQQGDGPHGCSRCELYFNRLCNLRRHERTIHAKERPYCCTLCLKSFTQSSGLKRHQESHSRHRAHRQSTALANATIYPCSHCPFSFTGERYLYKHIRRHHPEMTTKYLSFNEGELPSKEHSCTQCSKTFQTIRGFKNHACFRQGDQLYLCPDCGKAFSWFNSLKQHQRIHTGVKPYACSQCEKSFVHSGQLNVHMRTHTGEKPFLCAECGESFRQSGDLRRHEQKHSGVRPCQCPDCGKSFSRPQSLRAHQQLHKGTKLFPCTQCGKSFARRYHLTRHHQKMHS